MALRSLLLDGEWELRGEGPRLLPEFAARVPGNIELDLVRAEILPDPYDSDHMERFRPYEFFDWEYVREFDLPPDFPAAELVFEGIDGIAEVFLNGCSAGKAGNAFMPHRFAVDGLLRRGERNRIAVRLRSPINAARNRMLDHACFAHGMSYENLFLRKPAHEYGWDIAPRLLLGGLWKSVSLVEIPRHAMLCCYFDTLERSTAEEAWLGFSWSFRTDLPEWDRFELEIDGRCGDSGFRHREHIWFTSGTTVIRIPDPKLWNPAGYGEPSLYEVTIVIRNAGEELIRTTRVVGVRRVKLVYDETPGAFQFRFEVNGTPVMVKGTNHVPADALHSRDAERLPRILEMVKELGCNMIRVWGGGVYEPAQFYDFCDRNGILVWQDFMMACAGYPMTPDFLDRIRTECEWAVRELRQHPSLVLWAGDNEVDMKAAQVGDGRRQENYRITREVIPQVLARLDPGRPYLPSSPYFSPEVWDRGMRPGNEQSNCPEQHIWGTRDYCRAPFYSGNGAAFVSETGFHGAPAAESIKKFISPQRLWPGRGNPEWEAHSTMTPARIDLMFRQIQEFFGFEPDNLDDFIAASQLCQAEALKFFIERVRARKWEKSGIIWWNLIDCWPQFSDAVVDYYFKPKLAFDYIRCVQKPLAVILDEPESWGHRVIVTNDTLHPCAGTVAIRDLESGETLWNGSFRVGANANATAGVFEHPVGRERLLLVEWRAGGESGRGFRLTGQPPHDFARYRNLLPELLRQIN